MGWWEATVLGLVQGLTEFLPISSSAHLRAVAALLGWGDPGAGFTAVTQLGTETAVIIYFRHDLARIVRGWSLSLWHRPELRGRHDAQMGWYTIVGTVPIVVLGLLLRDRIETGFRDLRIVAATLIVFGVVLWLADHYSASRKHLHDLTLRDAVLFGFAQSLALVPGVSRSGGTISAGRLMSYDRKAAARYSFLLAIPAVIASGLLQVVTLGENESTSWGTTILAALIAGVVGFAVIAWLLRFLVTHTFFLFAAYRVALGLLLVVLIGAGALSPAP